MLPIKKMDTEGVLMLNFRHICKYRVVNVFCEEEQRVYYYTKSKYLVQFHSVAYVVGYTKVSQRENENRKEPEILNLTIGVVSNLIASSFFYSNNFSFDLGYTHREYGGGTLCLNYKQQTNDTRINSIRTQRKKYILSDNPHNQFSSFQYEYFEEKFWKPIQRYLGLYRCVKTTQ